MPSCMCTGRCRTPPYTCSGQPEPDFLTDQQRQDHEQAYLRGETNFQYPFEPWVLRSWARQMDENGWVGVADTVRENLKRAILMANDPNLARAQKAKKLIKNSAHGRKLPRSRKK